MVHTVDTMQGPLLSDVGLAQAFPNNSSDSTWLFGVVNKLTTPNKKLTRIIREEIRNIISHLMYTYMYMYDLCVVRPPKKCIIGILIFYMYIHVI